MGNFQGYRLRHLQRLGTENQPFRSFYRTVFQIIIPQATVFIRFIMHLFSDILVYLLTPKWGFFALSVRISTALVFLGHTFSCKLLRF